MTIPTSHDIERGKHRLLMAPQDVPTVDSVPWREPPITRRRASAAHRALFAEYAETLDEAMDLALDLWEGRISRRRERGMDEGDAVQDAYDEFFAGPAACPELVWTLRTFWLQCAEINRASPPDQRIPPQVVLLGWLVEARHSEWVQVLTAMPYWPIGMDRDRRWA